MKIRVQSEPLSPWGLLADYEAQLISSHGSGKYGASAVFVGSMRDLNEGDAVQGMYLEHYPGMTEKVLQGMAEAISREWNLIDLLLAHRVGDLHPGEPIVLVAVWSAHRKAAFEACRALMETLKSQAPFWKREHLTDGSQRWVEKNTAGY
ncbi:MAG: molybdenum cofactor biosynthesis protein MoaE [Chromatiales bacterium]|nr:molybdenum cofactor biosynthesis protein MoaE [Gammaproteobacteria bacterium]MBW6477759.1 molybdenum cofactor biosynthesis protein MoaE [Chromatiales bacterium]